MPQRAIGLPNPNRYGDTSRLPVGQLIDWVVQRHLAERAGEHYDVRLGTPDMGLLSWAVRKGLPTPGQKHLAIQQPVHSHNYKDFQGTIPWGYGKGEVSTHDKGEVLITRSSPNAVHFTTAHKGVPERFVMVRTGQGRDGKGWLLINTTPTTPIPYEKKRYVPVSAERAEAIIKQLPEGASVQPKVDGAAVLMPLLKDKIEVVSYRQSKRTGGPIVHTERMFHGVPSPYDYNMPSNLKGSLLRGEAYAIGKNDRAVDPHALGPLLNAGLANSIRSQDKKNLQLQTMLFDVERLGKKKVTDETPYSERYKMLQNIMQYLPQDRVHLVEQAKTPDAAMQLWNKIRNREHPLSQEGVVIHPPVGRPMKAKLFNDYDVHVTGVFPGEGKYLNNAAGGFTYSHQPGGPTVGRVGSGISDELRRQMWQDPNSFIGRVAKVTAQEQLPSGALRVPSLWTMHEDYPAAPVAKTAALEDEAPLLETAVEELNPTLPKKQQRLNLGHEPPPSAFEEGPLPSPPPSWVQHVMQNYTSTSPPPRIFTRPAQEIADAGDQEGVAPLGVTSWQRMVNFHRNRGGSRLPELQKEQLARAIQILSGRIKERKRQPDLFDPKTLLPIRTDTQGQAVKEAKVYVGEDAVTPKRTIEKQLAGLQKNLGTNYDPDVLVGTAQRWRDLGRYYLPKKVSDIPNRLARLGSAPLLGLTGYLPGTLASFPFVWNEAGQTPEYGGAWYHPMFDTINLPEHKLAPKLLPHELGHYADDKGYLYKDESHRAAKDSELSDELAAWTIARRAMGEKAWAKSEGIGPSASLATYLKGMYNTDMGGTPKEIEANRLPPPDKNWKQTISKKWEGADQQQRDRMVQRALNAVVPRDLYDRYASATKHPPGPQGDYRGRWMDQDLKGLIPVGNHLLNAEYARTQKFAAEVNPAEKLLQMLGMS